MYNILVSGDAFTNYPHIKELEGISCEYDFAEYISKEKSYSKAIIEGYMSFTVIDGKLMTQTSYISNRELTTEELSDLAEFTTGQWSDGIGEGFEQSPVFTSDTWSNDDGDGDVYISAWHKDQVLTVKQTARK